MWKDRMFTIQKYRTRWRPERACFLLSGRPISSHPVRVLVLSAPPPPPPPPWFVHSEDRTQECGSYPPTLVGCMFCFIRVESHDKVGMNIRDSVSTAMFVRLQQRLFKAPWTFCLWDWMSCYHNGLIETQLNAGVCMHFAHWRTCGWVQSNILCAPKCWTSLTLTHTPVQGFND